MAIKTDCGLESISYVAINFKPFCLTFGAVHAFACGSAYCIFMIMKLLYDMDLLAIYTCEQFVIPCVNDPFDCS